MLLSTVIKVALGLIFATLGYLVADKYLPITSFRVPFLVQTLSAFLFGATGVFLVPTISDWVKRVSYNFSQRVAQEVIKQINLRRFERKDKMETSSKSGTKLINPMLVDTSAIIDGRIAEIASSGFLFGALIIPKFVLSELQHIADHPDALKRGRGRRGFKILESLKKEKMVQTILIDDDLKEGQVDDKLVKLAKQMQAKIITNDFNLNKVATFSGVKILNVNELSQAVKSVALPGEHLAVKVIQEGKEKEQGVGYLPDGTMIVVEKGRGKVGKTVDVTVSRVIQTIAGRMIFTQIKDISN